MDSHDHDLLIRIDMNVLSLVAAREEHEKRIRSLESTNQTTKGAVKVAVTVASAAWALLVAGLELFMRHK